MSQTVRERCLQTIEVFSWNVHSFIDDDSGEPLADALAHDPSFSVVHMEPLFHHRGTDVQMEPFRPSLQSAVTRECKVVGITRVVRFGRTSQSCQAAIQAVGAQVGQGGRSRCALRQVASQRRASAQLEVVYKMGHPKHLSFVEQVHKPASRSATRSGYPIVRTSLHPRRRNGREEILEIQLQDHLPANVWRRKALDGTPSTKTMARRMGRNAIQDFREDPSLNRLQSRFRCLNQAPLTEAFCQKTQVIVTVMAAVLLGTRAAVNQQTTPIRRP